MKTMTFKSIQEIEPIETHKDGLTQKKMPVVIHETTDQCNVNFFELGPGRGNTANVYHHHAMSEEIFYIISGQGSMRTPEGHRPVKAGEIIVCPAYPESAHQLINDSDSEKLVYMNVATAQKPDIMFIPDSASGFIFTKDEVIPFSSDAKADVTEIPAAGGNSTACKK